ncbi:hypothetical protein I2486_21305 [Cellulophaga sp. E16_2]|uniref:hypothetical protein n=1 Tax=unclassified Cellulophaga TaxID=2634405 RepID=UPI0013FDBD7B|nr:MULTISPECIES: hypothetical protein [unclassified Cellulophaga]MBO0593945.1 hypothetical protein [Cellulophaga sp. E16_2]
MNQQEETFETWKENTFIRIDNWKETLKKDSLKIELNYSTKSLCKLEKYVLSEYTEFDLQNKKRNLELDAIASYIGETFIELIPESKWGIYARDKTNIYYNLPCIFTKYSGSISVHYLLREILSERINDVLEIRLNKILEKDKRIRKHIKHN